MTDENELSELRVKIQKVDADLLALFAERQALAVRVAQAKSISNLPIKNVEVEQSVIAASRKKAKELGLYEIAAEEMSRLLIKYSCLAQESSLAAKRAKPTAPRKIGIVGGAGKMGQWLAGALTKVGHELTLFDPKTSVPSYPHVATLARLAETCDVLILATPITVTARILDELVPLKPRGLVLDIGSLKSPLLAPLERLRKSGARVTSVHPMFGPQAEILADKNLVLCETGDPKADTEARDLFQNLGANLVPVPLGQHDRYMAQVLGLPHLVNLVLAHALKAAGIPFGDLKRVESTTFKAQIALTQSVCAENPDLYFEIQAENAESSSVLGFFRTALESYAEAIHKRDRKEFKVRMTAGHAYFNGET